MIICSMFGVMLLLFLYVIGFGVWRCTKVFTRRAAPRYGQIAEEVCSAIPHPNILSLEIASFFLSGNVKC